MRSLQERTLLLPAHAPTLYNYARALQLAGDSTQAAEIYTRALSCLSVTNASTCEEKRCVASVCNNLGVLYYSHPSLLNYSKAQELYERSASLSLSLSLSLF